MTPLTCLANITCRLSRAMVNMINMQKPNAVNLTEVPPPIHMLNPWPPMRLYLEMGLLGGNEG